MRTLALACLISVSGTILGCSSDAPAGSVSGAAGSAPVAAAGSANVAGGGSPSTAGSSGSASGGAAAGSGTGLSGASGSSGSPGASGSAGTAASAGAAGAQPAGDGTLGHGDYSGMGTSSARYYTAADIKRNGQNYVLITNGWGPGFKSHTISWNGTSFTVDKMEGTPGSGGQPASYPTVFCGQYSVMQRGDCGLPKPLTELTSLRTGWRWAPNGNEEGKYNAAYDIWVGDGTAFTGYLMVWLRDPPGFQPAGTPNAMHQGVTVSNVAGTWDIWNGMVNNRPIVNWVRREGTDSHEIEFDILDFVRDAEKRGLTIPGSTHVRAVAVGFEIWEGPIAGLQSLDFYVHVN
jgi:glycosyl hydrolase family 12